ncbi:MAG: hypothetical protein H7062_09455 [Candidatus Saccharimonas sp.]|nr:hypothetical protein [Planctomycetaceae bacterium]
MCRFVRGLLVALTMVLVGASEAWACPMCKMALETDDPQPRAYMFSILFMLGMIGSMFAVVTGLLIWLSRRERLELEAAGYQHLFENGVSQPAPESLH